MEKSAGWGAGGWRAEEGGRIAGIGAKTTKTVVKLVKVVIFVSVEV